MSLTLTWANRNRVLQADQVVDWLAASTGVEAGQHTALQVFDAADVLLAEKLDIGGETATVTSDYVGTLKFKLWSIRDDLDSWQPVEFEAVNASPAGTGTNIAAETWYPPDITPDQPHGESLVASGITPPVLLTNSDGTDYVYSS